MQNTTPPSLFHQFSTHIYLLSKEPNRRAPGVMVGPVRSSRLTWHPFGLPHTATVLHHIFGCCDTLPNSVFVATVPTRRPYMFCAPATESFVVKSLGSAEGAPFASSNPVSHNTAELTACWLSGHQSSTQTSYTMARFITYWMANLTAMLVLTSVTLGYRSYLVTSRSRVVPLSHLNHNRRQPIHC